MKAELLRGLPTAHSLADLAAQAGVSEREARRTLVEQGLPTEMAELREYSPALTDTLAPESSYGDELLEEAQRSARRHAVRHHQHFALTLPDRPFAVTFWGDWHIGEAGTEHLRLRDDRDALLRIRAKLGISHVLVGMGDYIGGYMRSKTPGNNAQVLDPAEQRAAASSLLLSTRPELIVQGDHDEWHARHDDQHEWLQELCRLNGLRFAQWGAALTLRSGSVKTRVLVRHRFDGSRKANPFLPQVNLHRIHGPAEVVAVGHYHSNPGLSMQRPERVSEAGFLAVQSGTYKVFDDYGKKLGVGNGEYGVPSVVVDPETGEVTPVPDLAELEAMLEDA